MLMTMAAVITELAMVMVVVVVVVVVVEISIRKDPGTCPPWGRRP